MSIQQDALIENYNEIAEGLQSLCRGWSRRRGGEPDELLQESFLYFMDALDRFNGQGDWKQWVMYRIKKNLLERARTIQYQKYSRPHDRNYDVLHCADTACPHTFEEVLQEMPLDAFVVTKLALDPPTVIQQEISRKGGSPRNIRSSIRRYLMDLGWSAQRVADSYSQIADILKGV